MIFFACSYSFEEKVNFASKTYFGECLLTRKCIYTKDHCKTLTLENDGYSEGYRISKDKLLLIKTTTFGSLEVLFSFSVSIMELKTGLVTHSKSYKNCDYRGLKGLRDHVLIALNHYSSSLLDENDPENLCCEPPCPQHADYAEIMVLDFKLNQVSARQYDETLPDDLIVYLGCCSDELTLISNNDKLFPFDRFITKIGNKTYGVKDGCQLLEINEDGVRRELYKADSKIVGMRAYIHKSLVNFILYQEDREVHLRPDNSLDFIFS